MNNASLHVCISIIQTNHYICSIIFIMNYSPAWSAHWQSKRHAWVWIQVAGWRCWWFLWKAKQTDVFLTSNWTPGEHTGLILLCQIQTRSSLWFFKDTGCLLKAKPVFYLLQDKVEEADRGGAGAAGGGWKLLRSAEDVPIPVLLSAEPGVQPGSRSGPILVQRPLGAPTGPTETPGPAHPAARPAGRQRAAASSAPNVRRASPASSAAVSSGEQRWAGACLQIFFLSFSYPDCWQLGTR